MPNTTAATRTVDGVDLPAGGVWVIDPSHTSVEFVARHLMVSKVRGGFQEFSGTIVVTDDPTESRVEVDVEVDSVDTGVDDRDAHLRSPDFFDAKQYPTMTYRSSRVTGSGRSWSVAGELTIRGTTHPLDLDVEFLGVATDPWGNAKMVLSATGEVDREAYGLTWNVPLEAGGVLVSKKARIEIEAQAVLQSG